MKIKFLLLGASLSFIPSLTFAQCVATQDCKTLGYTETSCNGGKGVKCPFGNLWACIKSDSEFCNEYGFTLSCNEANQTPGSKACNNKYNYCNCADGYEWKNGVCKEKQADYADCKVGTLFYSDNTCSTNKVSGKTLLGVVIMEKTTSQIGWIMTINPIQTYIAWSTEYVDIPGLGSCTSESCLIDTQASCTNTDIITAYSNSSKYPAAWAAKNYKPAGTPSGKSWCLPSGGLLNSTLNNSTNLYRINVGITTARGTKIGFGTSYDKENIWSSSEYSDGYAWEFYATTSGSFNMSSFGKDSFIHYHSVRPVMAF